MPFLKDTFTVYTYYIKYIKLERLAYVYALLSVYEHLTKSAMCCDIVVNE